MWPQDRMLSGISNAITLRREVINGMDNRYETRIKTLLPDYCVNILPMRSKNIMIEVEHKIDTYLPDNITLHFLRQDELGSSTSSYYFLTLPFQISKDRTTKKYNILDAHINQGEAPIDRICVDCNGPLDQDVTLSIKVLFKYVYEIHAGTYRDSIWFQDGNYHHEEGDTFQDAKGNEITVMDIDETSGILYCSATGFIHNM